MKLNSILVLQNKIDLVREVQAKEQYQQIVDFVKGTNAEGAPIIPISAQLKYNIEVICEYITRKIPVPMRDFTSKPRLISALNLKNKLKLMNHFILFLNPIRLKLFVRSMLTSLALKLMSSKGV